MLLTGTYLRLVDDKQRVALPKPIREALGAAGEHGLYLAPGTDGSLALYPEPAFSRLAAQLAAASPNASDVRAFSRLFYAQAQRVDVDRQARIRIPAELAQLANLQRELVLIGVRDHLELWNREHWERYLQQQQAQYDDIAERAFTGGRNPIETRTPSANAPGGRAVRETLSEEGVEDRAVEAEPVRAPSAPTPKQRPR